MPISGSRYFRLVRPTDGPPPEIQNLLRLAAVFLISYLVIILGSSTLLDASLSLDQRVLGPIQVVAYLILASLSHWAVRSRTGGGIPIAPFAVPVVVVLLLVLPNAMLAYRQLDHPFPAPRPTSAFTALAKLRISDLIFTNEPSGVFVYAHRGSVLAPVRSYIITTRPNPSFKADVVYVGNVLRRRHGVVALVPDIQAPLLTVAELQHWAGLVVTRRFADGTVFLTAPHR